MYCTTGQYRIVQKNESSSAVSYVNYILTVIHNQGTVEIAAIPANSPLSSHPMYFQKMDANQPEKRSCTPEHRSPIDHRG